MTSLRPENFPHHITSSKTTTIPAIAKRARRHADHANNGTDGPFVQAMTPEIAIISAGDPSAAEPGQFTAFHHGHPNRKALLALSDPTFGVSMSRPPKLVGVGVKGARPGGLAPAEFARETVSRAIFSTGWDGDIVIIADRNGNKRVIVD